MVKDILAYQKMERVADVGHTQILSYILVCFLLAQTFFFGNGVFSLTLWVFIYTIQKLRRVSRSIPLCGTLRCIKKVLYKTC